MSICHATSSNSNPYVFMTVAADSILDPRTGEVEGHGTDSGTHGRDIIPPFSYTWGGREYEYAGKNIDDDTAAFLASRCRAEADAPPDPGSPADPAGGFDPDPPPIADSDPVPGDEIPGDVGDLTPPNRVVIKDLDEIAPNGLGDAETPRSVDGATSTEAVLRVRIRPSVRRPRVGERVVFRVTGSALGPAPAIDGTLCAAVPAGFSLADAGSGTMLGRVICWLQGVAPNGSTTRSFVAVPRRAAAGRMAIAPAANSASNAYRVLTATAVWPRLAPLAVAVAG